MSNRSAKDFKEEQGPVARFNASRLRRMAVSVTSRVFWQLLGPKSHESKQPTTEAENFSGIGFYARPLTTDKAEAVLASIGDARHSIIIATRNEDVRKQIANLEPNETAIFTSLSTVVIKADGTVEIRTKDGTAQSLATKADLQAVVDALDGHTHKYIPYPGGVAGTPIVTTDNPSVPDPDGTTVLLGE